MKITRRSTLAILGATSVVGLPAGAANSAPPLINAPTNLFPQDLAGQRVLRVALTQKATTTQFAQFCIVADDPAPEDFQEFSSFRDLLFSALRLEEVERGYRINFDDPTSYDIKEPILISGKVTMNRHAVRIAANTRRGAGKTIFHSRESVFDFAFPALKDYAFDFYETSALKRDEIAIIYHGEAETCLDGPFRARILSDGRVLALVHKQSKDYGVILKAV